MLDLYFPKEYCESFTSVSKAEFLTLAENLRPYTEQAMKIEPAPWIRDYVVDMEALYTEVNLERTEYGPYGKKTTLIEDYRDLFQTEKEIEGQTPELAQESEFKKSRKGRGKSSSLKLKNKEIRQKASTYRRPGKKILAKGDPGKGKSTFCKKVAWDWARGVFIAYSIVFIVFLKLVRPGDAIENVIIQQMPELEGFCVSPRKLQSILESHGSECLLILDGLDDHDLGWNRDVLKIIRGQKYLNCGIILTSRPHTTKGIEGYFDTIVRVQGFSFSQARMFCLEDFVG